MWKTEQFAFVCLITHIHCKTLQAVGGKKQYSYFIKIDIGYNSVTHKIILFAQKTFYVAIYFNFPIPFMYFVC